MPIKVLMPALSPTMKDGTLAKWHVKEGSEVNPGDLIAEIETDKATMEVEAVDEGKIGRILVDEGTKHVKVNSVIAVLLEEGEDKAAIDKMDLSSEEEGAEEKDKTEKAEEKETPKEESGKPAANEEKKPATKSPSQPAPQPQAPKQMPERVFASPLAKRIAAEKNIDLGSVKGSGPKGRVIKNDVLNYKGTSFSFSKGQVTRAHPETSELPVSTMREVIAQRLQESKQNIPHFYLSIDCNMDKLLQMRQDINALANKDNPEFKISVNDMVIKAAALALALVPAANSSWNGNSVIQYNNVDISVAVAIKEGLITPIVKNADQKSLFEISEEMKELAHKAKAGTLKPEEFQGGSFSISNLGMYGIKQFSAIINPPQSCILSVGATREEALVKKGELEICNVMTLTLSCDHRVVDGAVGAELMNNLKQAIENPVRMLL